MPSSFWFNSIIISRRSDGVRTLVCLV
ncbi:hypothetical protein NECAME_14032 [Necator americanus]|uniref:Uncharacterized protein n=1 Tax=Necator americanus TaxID=51031 RepID=W2STF7_NECAM|nr:hypothetical protein NECAME_14032 [Necator americanus]ETN71987.1 hypothetical protein NECAME_14032 [Necator americanus]